MMNRVNTDLSEDAYYRYRDLARLGSTLEQSGGSLDPLDGTEEDSYFSTALRIPPGQAES